MEPVSIVAEAAIESVIVDACEPDAAQAVSEDAQQPVEQVVDDAPATEADAAEEEHVTVEAPAIAEEQLSEQGCVEADPLEDEKDANLEENIRSEERRVGKAGVRRCKAGW